MPALPPGRNIPSGTQSNGSRPIRVYNTDAEAVPPFGGMEVVGYDPDRSAFKVARCTLTGRNDLLFNSMTPIPSGMEGQARSDIHITAGFVPAEGDNPHAGEIWGVPAGEWLLKPNHTGYVVVDTTTAVRGFCVVQTQRHNLTEFVRIVGTGSGGVPATYYNAVLSQLNPVTGAWAVTTFPVWFREASGRTIAAGEYAGALDVPAVRVGYSFGRPVYVGKFASSISPLTTKGDIYVRNATVDTRLPVGSNGQFLSADSSESTGLKWITPAAAGSNLCAWLVGLQSCLLLTVDSVTGLCADIGTSQEIDLNVSGSNEWTGSTNFTHDGGTGAVVFSLTAPTPTLTIGGVGGFPIGCDANGMLYRFGGTTLCDGTLVDCGDNSFVVRLTCRCCSIEGWDGPGWYCIESEPVCGACPDGVPFSFTFTLADGTDDFAGANGSWTVTRTTGCVWEGVLGDFTATLTHSGSSATIEFLGPGDVPSFSYSAADLIDCCGPIAMVFAASDGTGTPPSDPTLTALGPCTTCTVAELDEADECDSDIVICSGVYATEELALDVCGCAEILGWQGAGWYCVRTAGTEDDCAPVELLAADRCDTTIEICTGPYANEAAAEAVCVPTEPVYNATCGTTPPCYLPNTVKVVITGTQPDLPPGGVTVYTSGSSGPLGAGLWYFDASGGGYTESNGLGWRVAGAIACWDSSGVGSCDGVVSFEGGGYDRSGSVAFSCPTYTNQTTTGTLTPGQVAAVIDLNGGLFVLTITDFGAGDPDC